MPAPQFAQARPLIGQSPKMLEVKKLIKRLGPTSTPVLIYGETGTGKEVVARNLYEQAPAGPFVTIECSALVGTLMESELFGHTKGAFTGADRPKTGLLEAATGGTAFFDEIGELPLEYQAKLLRVLQEKELRPVGSLTSKRVEFRVIAATNRDLAREVEAKRFREDLYFRLNVARIAVPPLRERKEDIPVLASHFLALQGGRFELTADALQALMQYDWRGNVRELDNCIRQMVALHSGPFLNSPDLPSAVLNAVREKTAAGEAVLAAALPSGNSQSWSAPVTVRQTQAASLNLKDIERNTIIRALEVTRGDRVAASHLLGIGRTTLYRKIKTYRLET